MENKGKLWTHTLVSIPVILIAALKRAKFVCNPRFRELKQEDRHKFKTSLICIAKTRVIGGTQEDLIKRTKLHTSTISKQLFWRPSFLVVLSEFSFQKWKVKNFHFILNLKNFQTLSAFIITVVILKKNHFHYKYSHIMIA